MEAGVWGIASQQTRPETMREWEGDGKGSSGPCKPDAYVVQTDAGLDQAGLPANYVQAYRRSSSRESADPRIPVLIRRQRLAERDAAHAWCSMSATGAKKPEQPGRFPYMLRWRRISTRALRMLKVRDRGQTIRCAEQWPCWRRGRGRWTVWAEAGISQTRRVHQSW